MKLCGFILFTLSLFAAACQRLSSHCKATYKYQLLENIAIIIIGHPRRKISFKLHLKTRSQKCCLNKRELKSLFNNRIMVGNKMLSLFTRPNNGLFLWSICQVSVLMPS